ncbi:hypothetical protein O3M35_001473 [Rhynocoris fuscipes]|uniref:Uncharacterized protein n=1 Tax=Rhynocoris fuscipes TaxID=488301 RepID=A0AAW1CV85_9HEMI
MQPFAFGTTCRCADYMKISNQSGQQNSSKLRDLFVHDIFRTAVDNLNIFFFFFFVFPPNVT